MERSGGRRAGGGSALLPRHPPPRTEGGDQRMAGYDPSPIQGRLQDRRGSTWLPQDDPQEYAAAPPDPQHEHRSSVHGSSFRILFPRRVRVSASLRHQGFPWIPRVPLPIFVTKIRGASRPGRRADSPVLPENLSRSRWQPARRMDLPRTGCHFEPVQLLFDLVKGVVLGSTATLGPGAACVAQISGRANRFPHARSVAGFPCEALSAAPRKYGR